MDSDIHKKIKAKLTIFVDAMRTKDVETMVSVFDEDSIVLGGTSQSPIEAHGHDEIKQVMSLFIKNLIDGDIFSSHIFQIGDEIYEMGTNRMVVENEGQQREVKGNYVTVWKQNEGDWFVKKDMLPPMPE
ncbi:MAG: YybH family protein [Candidatus Heimdallarchaeota archaeon]